MTIKAAKEILNIDNEDNIKQIKENYRKLANKYHPDKKGGDTSKFSQINKAKRILLKQDNSTDPVLISLLSPLMLQKKIYKLWQDNNLHKYLEYKDLSLNEIKNKLKQKSNDWAYQIISPYEYNNSLCSDFFNSELINNKNQQIISKINIRRFFKFMYSNVDFRIILYSYLAKKKKETNISDADFKSIINWLEKNYHIQKVDSDIVWFDKALNIFKKWNEYRILENERDALVESFKKI